MLPQWRENPRHCAFESKTEITSWLTEAFAWERPLGTGELLGYPQVSLEDSPPPSPQSVALDGRALVTLSLQSLEVCYKDLLLWRDITRTALGDPGPERGTFLPIVGKNPLLPVGSLCTFHRHGEVWSERHFTSISKCVWSICTKLNIYPCVCVLVTQLCLTFCDPTDCSPPGSFVHGILQATIVEWVANLRYTLLTNAKYIIKMVNYSYYAIETRSPELIYNCKFVLFVQCFLITSTLQSHYSAL